MHQGWVRWGFSAFFEDVTDHGVRDRVTEARFHDFLSEQAQGPPGVACRGIATRERRDLGALQPINDDGSAGARRVVETGEPVRAVVVAPDSDGVVIDLQGGRDGGERLAAIKFEQGGRAFEGPSGQRPFGKQGRERFVIRVGEGDMWFLHPGSLYDYARKCKKI